MLAAPRTRLMDRTGSPDTVWPRPARAYDFDRGPNEFRAHIVLEDGPLGWRCPWTAENLHGHYFAAAFER